MAKRTYHKFATPRFVAAYAHISEPDVGGEYSDGKFKVTCIIDKNEDKELLELITQAYASAVASEWPDGPPQGMNKLFTDVKEVDQSGNKVINPDKYKVTFKTTSKPRCEDSKGRALPESVTIASGDIIRVAAAAAAYTQGNQGVSLYLNSVRLIEKRAGSDDFGGQDEGFEMESEDTTASMAPVFNL